MIKTDSVLEIISKKLPSFTAVGEPLPVAGGNLNYIWRLQGKDRSIIIKHAPPFIASNPDVPLDAERIAFETKALQLFKNNELLSDLQTPEIRPPQLIAYESDNHVLIMEDLKTDHDISGLPADSLSPKKAGELIGNLIGSIHLQTYQSDRLRDTFNNKNIQQVRSKIQYGRAGEYAQKGGIVDYKPLQNITTSLGRRMTEPGKCLIMGDLWPSSVLIKNDALRIIDWEFVHFGRPLQDVGHFSAHCWMQAHTADNLTSAKTFELLWHSFWKSYKQAAGDKLDKLFDQREYRDAATHTGAEILIRATGVFKGSYVYGSFPNDSKTIQEAVQKAAELIKADDFSKLWN